MFDIIPQIPMVDSPIQGELIECYMAHLWHMTGEESSPSVFYNTYFPSSNNVPYPPSAISVTSKAIASADRIHAEEPAFPTVVDIIMSHTCFVAYLPFFSFATQAYSLWIANDDLKTPIQSYLASGKEVAYCPECAKRDIARYGRPVFYVLHQLDYMKFCPEHHCALHRVAYKKLLKAQDFLDEGKTVTERNMTETDERIGLLYQSQLEKKLFVSEEITEDIFYREFMDEEAIRKTLIEKKIPGDLLMKKRSYKMSYAQGKCDVRWQVPMIASVCTTMDSYQERIQYDYTANLQKQLSKSPKKARLEAESVFSPVMRFRCRKCGAVFYTHPADILLGRRCPRCTPCQNTEELMSVYVEGTDIKILDVHGRQVRYENEAGNVSRTDAQRLLEQNIAPQKLHVTATSGHVGERRYNYCGRNTTLTEYKDKDHVTVTFDDKVSVRTNYLAFIKGFVRHPDDKSRFVVDYTGEIYTLENGMTAEVIANTSFLDCTVKLQDGSIIHTSHDRIKSSAEIFLRQRERQRKRQEQFIRHLDDGRVAIVTEYHSWDDVEVLVSDGTRYRMTFQNFKHSLFSAPGPENAEVLTGAVSVSQEGERITCTCFRRYNDMDVVYEDGTAVRHCTYWNFISGNICRSRSRHDSMVAKNRRKYLGMKRTLPDGRIATIIGYDGAPKTTVALSDGTVYRDFNVYRFQESRFVTPSKENADVIAGMESVTDSGEKCICTKFNSWKDMDVELEDGTVIEHVKYEDFIYRRIARPVLQKEKYIGRKRILEDGRTAEITADKGNGRVTVTVSDGTIYKNFNAYRFMGASFVTPDPENAPAIVGKKSTTNKGEACTCVAFHDCRDMDVKVEPDTMLHHVSYADFIHHRIGYSQGHERSRKEYIGLSRTLPDGRVATITAYDGCEEATVSVSDGTVYRNFPAYTFYQAKFLNPGLENASVIIGMECRLRNSAEMGKCIAFRSHRDLDIQLEDGTIKEHVSYADFIHGHVAGTGSLARNKNKYLGMKRTLPDGRTAAITEYVTRKNVTVTVSDGTVYRNFNVAYFGKAQFLTPSEENASAIIGKEYLARSGSEKCTCVAFRDCLDLDVRFEDGTIRQHVSYADLIHQRVAHPDTLAEDRKKYIGLSRTLQDGRTATITGYDGPKKVTVAVGDGTTYRNFHMVKFYKAAFTKPGAENADAIVGKRAHSRSGIDCTCIAFRSWNDMDVRFDDGTVRQHVCYAMFLHGQLYRPFIGTEKR